MASKWIREVTLLTVTLSSRACEGSLRCTPVRSLPLFYVTTKYMTYYKNRERNKWNRRPRACLGTENVVISAHQEMVNLLDELFRGKEHH
ncbi:hypothetical protein EV401DRAFT_2039443 [Pisolithus croceorrhizus]|nr:hypothetical protein EV401DRAFT_2039443 [Pisolithus croceorrhizus]